MSAESDNLDPLVALLKSKQAPPASDQFFSQMSHRIRDGIRNSPPPAPRTWWQRLTSDLDLKAGVAGVLVCGGMLVAVLVAIKLDANQPRSELPPYTMQVDQFVPPAMIVVTPPPRPEPASDSPPAPASTVPLRSSTASNALFTLPGISDSIPVNDWSEPQ